MQNRCIGPWTIYEDKTLIDLIEKYGPQKWSFISKALKGRSGKQCRERWYNQLSPDINMSEWSLEEEMLLLLMHNKLGNKWSELRKYLKGRTDNNIKNHWNSKMKKNIELIKENLKNKILEIKNRYRENNDIISENLLINEFMEIIEIQMEKIQKEKMESYEYFKNINISDKIIDKNTITALNLRKILGHTTRSKKTKNGIVIHEKNKNKFNYDKFEIPIIKNNKIIIRLSSKDDLNKKNINNKIEEKTEFNLFDNTDNNSSDKKVLITNKYSSKKNNIDYNIHNNIDKNSKPNFYFIFNIK